MIKLRIVLFIAFLTGNGVIHAQQNLDTGKSEKVNLIKKLITQAIQKNLLEYKEKKSSIKQDEIFEETKKTISDLKTYLKLGIDTVGVNAKLERLVFLNAIAGDGVFTSTGTAQSHRNLVITSKLLKELLGRALISKLQLDGYNKNLMRFQSREDSLLTDSVMFILPSDSAGFFQYLQKIKVIALEVRPVDIILKEAIPHVQSLQNKANLLVNRLSSEFEQTDIMQKELSNRILQREFANIGGPVGFSRPFSEILDISIKKEKLELLYYCRNNPLRIFFLFVLIATSSVFLRSLKKHVKKNEKQEEDFSSQLVLRYPLLSAILIVTSLYQFVLLEPPFILNMLIWSVSAVCLTIIFHGYITKFWMIVWLSLLCFFLLSGLDNLILQASRPERWFMLILAAAGAITSVIFLINGDRHQLKEKWIIYFIGFGVFLESLSIIMNVFGRYNMSKTLMVSGFVNGVIAILFLWTVRLINQGLTLAFNVYQTPERKLFYINFERIGNRVPPLFNILLIVGWFVLFGQNFYAFRLIAQPVENFLFSDRTIGNYSFSISSMLIFFSILLISWLVSSIVSFFASDRIDPRDHDGARKTGIGSWLLLIRITIISTGIFMAFAATGIPIDRIAIVLGALSVGIGFGLQSIVQNLVSGLIISFEKPVNVGDIVEIGNREGIMKSIGFRSSVISTLDGADVVIPNGDLLNQHLVNWTHGKTTRRVDVTFSVAYGTDMENLKSILMGLTTSDARIKKYPSPTVYAKQFGNDSLELHLNFWVLNITEYSAVRSDMIEVIDTAFKKNSIIIH